MKIDREQLGRERSLIFAVLERAILDAAGHDMAGNTVGGNHHDKAHALAWILQKHEDEIGDPFSFPWICEHLGGCAKTIRKRVIKYIQSEVKAKKSHVCWDNMVNWFLEETSNLCDNDMIYSYTKDDVELYDIDLSLIKTNR